MRKILVNLAIIGVIAAAAIGATVAYFSDVETSSGNIFTAGTIDISVNDQNPWSETFTWNDAKPGKEKEIVLQVKNVGENPAKIWKIIKNVAVEENGIIEPEQDWYNKYNSGNPKNDIDFAMLYSMEVDGNVVIDEADGKTVGDIKDSYMYLGTLDQDATMTVKQTYHFKDNAENWAQSDKMTFDMEILATQLSVSDPIADSTPTPAMIYINEPGGDINNQYGYWHNYLIANVSFTYYTPASGRLCGVITAGGLKPYATYQVKFEGKPNCLYGLSGNDLANEYIGYKGRWWDNTTNSNVNDAYYAANSIYKGGTHCITGYLVWDFFTADASGNASKILETANSYHVLWAGGGSCNTNLNNYLAYLDPAHPAVLFSPSDKVDGEIERGVCGGMTLNVGGYDLRMVLTEESFHQGNWATVLGKDISFTIE